ncbi:hypothetical protein, partial [Pseudomonas syringae group genomosp. 7]|uniref:hypothetical protein n=1 Tax=Pseudomonas syringae group genomosp. 7 TaxID=251699 RepID=UPI0037705425
MLGWLLFVGVVVGVWVVLRVWVGMVLVLWVLLLVLGLGCFAFAVDGIIVVYWLIFIFSFLLPVSRWHAWACARVVIF